jgi:RTX calcium-binding nonapeptide repeat (4 copies)
MTHITPHIHRVAGLAVTLALAAVMLAPATAPAGPTIKINPAILQLFLCPSNPTIAGNGANNSLQGTAGNDKMRGYGGVDSAVGKGGHDVICADSGNDHGLYGQAGNDTIRGGTGNDSAVTGNEGNDWIFGDAGDDSLGAHPGLDSVYGGADNDILYGDTWPVGGNDATDKDYLDGGPGTDTCYPGFEDTVTNCETVIWPPQPPA